MVAAFRPLNVGTPSRVRTAPVAEPEVAFREVRGKRIAYDANSMAAVEISSELLWDKLRKHGNRDLCSQPLPGQWPLVGQWPPHASLLFCEHAPQFPLPPQLPNPHVVLNITHACNLDCVYCFTKAYPDVDDGKPLTMNFETAARGIERLAPGPRRHIAFFGGEPMLQYELMQQIVERFDGPDTTWGITTNATMIYAEEARWLAGHKFSAIVSLDGPAEIHNANRPMRAGEDSYMATRLGLRALRDAGMAERITLRGTFRSPEQLVPMLVYLNNFVRRGFAKHVSVEPVERSEGCATEPSRARLGDSWQPTIAAYHDLCDWLLEEARAGRRAIVHNLSVYLRRLATRSPQCSECGAGRNYYTIAPDGTIHACHRERSEIGHVDYGIDEAARVAWLDNRYYVQPQCPDCAIRHVCGGGCRAGRLGTNDHLGCAYANLWFNCALWLLSELSPDEVQNLI